MFKRCQVGQYGGEMEAEACGSLAWLSVWSRGGALAPGFSEDQSFTGDHHRHDKVFCWQCYKYLEKKDLISYET